MSCVPDIGCRCEECQVDRAQWTKMGFIARCKLINDLKVWMAPRRRKQLRFMIAAVLEGLYHL